jgi:hypothetical protein
MVHMEKKEEKEKKKKKVKRKRKKKWKVDCIHDCMIIFWTMSFGICIKVFLI